MRAPLILFLLAAAPAAALADPLPSPVIYPPQRLPLTFSHARHAQSECGVCHGDAARSRRAADLLLPGEATCAKCHPIAPGRCATCHAGWDGTGAPPQIRMPPPNLKFNHEIHVTRGMRCLSCHPVASLNLATRAQLPRMASCLACHDGKRAPSACATCHLTGAAGTLRTDFPEGTLRGADHDLRFRLDHARAARADARACASCHRRSFCADCHDGVKKPLDFHGNDYVALHALDARRATTRCRGCHRLQTFCTGCHARLGVSDDPKTSEYVGPTATRRFHPDGWVDAGAGASLHAVEARRNLRTCASCHREETCRGCHATINPHPAGWAGSRRCAALLARDGRMCLRCHARLEEARCD